MARSFWEKLGQGVGRGLEKARAVGESIGEEAGKRLDAGSARRRLRAAHEKLGEACARVRLDGADEADLLAALGDVEVAREQRATAVEAPSSPESTTGDLSDESDAAAE